MRRGNVLESGMAGSVKYADNGSGFRFEDGRGGSQRPAAYYCPGNRNHKKERRKQTTPDSGED